MIRISLFSRRRRSPFSRRRSPIRKSPLRRRRSPLRRSPLRRRRSPLSRRRSPLIRRRSPLSRRRINIGGSPISDDDYEYIIVNQLINYEGISALNESNRETLYSRIRDSIVMSYDGLILDNTLSLNINKFMTKQIDNNLFVYLANLRIYSKFIDPTPETGLVEIPCDDPIVKIIFLFNNQKTESFRKLFISYLNLSVILDMFNRREEILRNCSQEEVTTLNVFLGEIRNYTDTLYTYISMYLTYVSVTDIDEIESFKNYLDIMYKILILENNSDLFNNLTHNRIERTVRIRYLESKDTLTQEDSEQLERYKRLNNIEKQRYDKIQKILFHYPNQIINKIYEAVNQ
tara:strand:+ start:1106 stop:2143 length:1038 start_codon:yes stop_codon:yes gene_type:complete